MRPRREQDREAVRRGHRRVATVTLHHPGGEVGPLEFEDGSVQWNLGQANGTRSGSLRIPGYAAWDLVRPQTNAWVTVDIEVDGHSWSLGEFPVVRATVVRPRGVVEVSLGDWCFRRVRSVAEFAQDVGAGRTLAVMAAQHLTHVMPWEVTCTRDDTNGALQASPMRFQAGQNVWAAMQEAAGMVGAQLVMTSRSTVEVRVWDPGAFPVEDITGTVLEETSTEDATELVNRVIITADSEAPDGGSFRSVRTLTTGAYALDRLKMGYGQAIDTVRLPVASQAAADAEADRVAARRYGIVRTFDLDVVPQPWIEAGDCVLYRPTASGTGTPVPTWMVEQLSFPLTARGTSRITARRQVS
jgi:hypothetical protein